MDGITKVIIANIPDTRMRIGKRVLCMAPYEVKDSEIFSEYSEMFSESLGTVWVKS